MAFARRKQPETGTLPRRTSSLRVSSTSSIRSRTPSVTHKGTHDKDQSNLEAISESNPSDAPVQPVPKAVTAAPVISRKKSVVALRGKPSNENFPAGTAVPRREVSTSSHPSIREIRTRPRPLSVTGIPSPSPTRTGSMHTRKDKYDGITNDAHRRTASLRSVSGNTERKLNTDSKSYTFSGRTIVPPRESSKRVTEDPQVTRKNVTLSSKEISTAPAHKRHPSKDASSSSQLPATTTQRPLKSQQSKDLGQSPVQSPAQRNNDAPRASTSRESSTVPTHTRQTSRDISFSSQHSNSTIQRPLKSQPSKDFNHTPPRVKKEAPPPIASRSPSSHPAHSRQSSRDIPSSSAPAKPIAQRPLKSQPSRDLAPPSRETPLTPVRKQRSKDLSPTPSSSHSSPKPKPKATSLPSTDPPPEQTRLLQLLHLIPLSETSLATYESSAHKTLSTRYASLQSRFQKIQEHDHAQYLTDTLKTLKLWSDGNIRTLFNLLTDWESLTIDFRGFCKRLSSTLKPINKSVLEEKGTPIHRSIGNLDRLFSRLQDVEVMLMSLPTTVGWPGQVVEEIRINLPLLRREVELAITVGGLRWRREVLHVEAKRMDVVRRLSLGKPGREGVICAWREES